MTSDIRGVWGKSSTDVWAATEDGKILHYDGNLWTKQAEVPIATRYAIWGLGPDNIYAVGDDAKLMRYDGAHWKDLGARVERSRRRAPRTLG